MSVFLKGIGSFFKIRMVVLILCFCFWSSFASFLRAFLFMLMVNICSA